MLSIKNLHVSIGDKPIIKGLTLDLPKGEVHAVMGPNGAGKIHPQLHPGWPRGL